MTGEISFRLVKGQLLIEEAGVLVAIATGFFDHVQDSGFRGRNRRGPLLDINPLRLNAFPR